MVVFPAVLSFCVLYAFLSSPFPNISRRFVTRALVGDDILDFSGLLIALATLDALRWIVYVMVSAHGVDVA